jgi:hypothetical protein
VLRGRVEPRFQRRTDRIILSRHVFDWRSRIWVLTRAALGPRRPDRNVAPIMTSTKVKAFEQASDPTRRVGVDADHACADHAFGIESGGRDGTR